MVPEYRDACPDNSCFHSLNIGFNQAMTQRPQSQGSRCTGGRNATEVAKKKAGQETKLFSHFSSAYFLYIQKQFGSSQNSYLL